jgi:hypothetical protein
MILLQRNVAAIQTMNMGRDETRAKVVGHVYHIMFNPKTEYSLTRNKEHFPESPPVNE